MNGIEKIMGKARRKGVVAVTFVSLVIAGCGGSDTNRLAADARLRALANRNYSGQLGGVNTAPIPRSAGYDPFNGGALAHGLQPGMYPQVDPRQQQRVVICAGKPGCPEDERKSKADEKSEGDKEERERGAWNRRSSKGPKVETSQDDSLAIAQELCTDDEYRKPGKPDDKDHIGKVCEDNGKDHEFFALDSTLFNGYKVAAVSIPPEGKNWFTRIFKSAQRQDNRIKGNLVTVDQIREFLDKGYFKEEGYERIAPIDLTKMMPQTSLVSIVDSGNRNTPLTLGGIADGDDAKEKFGVSKLPRIPSIAETIKQEDGFMYVVEAWINYPTSFNPRMRILGSRGAEAEASAIIVFVNGNIIVHSFTKKDPLEGDDANTRLGNYCAAGEPCHLVAALYSARKSNKLGKFLIESLLIDMDPSDDRGLEPLPGEIAAPVPPAKFQYAPQYDSSEAAIRILVNKSDEENIRKCDAHKKDVTGNSNVVDLTDCRALFESTVVGPSESAGGGSGKSGSAEDITVNVGSAADIEVSVTDE